jgi:hypothetical protein
MVNLVEHLKTNETFQSKVASYMQSATSPLSGLGKT